jgi:hypothetical protein
MISKYGSEISAVAGADRPLGMELLGAPLSVIA